LSQIVENVVKQCCPIDAANIAGRGKSYVIAHRDHKNFLAGRGNIRQLTAAAIITRIGGAGHVASPTKKHGPSKSGKSNKRHDS